MRKTIGSPTAKKPENHINRPSQNIWQNIVGKDVLSSDVEIKGSIKFQKELLIDGKVEARSIPMGS